MPHSLRLFLAPFALCAALPCAALSAAAQPPAARPPGDDSEAIKAELGANDTVQAVKGNLANGAGTVPSHTQHPDAQWYPDASFGLFIHWGVASVGAINISWPMIPGRKLEAEPVKDKAEQARVLREGDWNLDGTPNSITPNRYWAMEQRFNPQAYDPDKWIKAAKEAGFAYVVLTTRHHEGFALWPSAYGDFDTRNHMGGRDLLRPYVEACRKYGVKVGFYYSVADWYFDRDYMNFLYHSGKANPWLPSLDGDLKPRTASHSPSDISAHNAAYYALIRGQIEELLTHYGKIDLIWFDVKPSFTNGEKFDANVCMPIERIRALQPGILINPRMHGPDNTDFVTFERRLPKPLPKFGWAELCNPWTSSWPYTENPETHQELPYRDGGAVLGELALCRSLGINYLLDVGPKSTGELSDNAYANMAVVAGWMKKNRESVIGARPLPKGESASVPATAQGAARYLFAIPKYRGNRGYPGDRLPPQDVVLTLSGVKKPSAVTLLGNGEPVAFKYQGGAISVALPANRRTDLVDVLRIDFAEN